MKKVEIIDLYGFELEDLEEARYLVEGVLAINLEAHESLYLGGDYFRKQLGQGELILQSNIDLLWQDGDPSEERWAEPEFADYPILLYLEGQFDSDAIRDQLTKNTPKICLLRRA